MEVLRVLTLFQVLINTADAASTFGVRYSGYCSYSHFFGVLFCGYCQSITGIISADSTAHTANEYRVLHWIKIRNPGSGWISYVFLSPGLLLTY